MTPSPRALALLALLTLAGCKQGVNERCQVTTDCQDGLVCIIPTGGSLAEGGTCQPLATVDGGVDLASGADLAGADLANPDGPITTPEDMAGADLATAPDLAPEPPDLVLLPDLIPQG